MRDSPRSTSTPALQLFDREELAIEADFQHVDNGFWTEVTNVNFRPSTEAKMPRTCDRFREAVHFLQLLQDLPPVEESLALANWYVGAHLVAVIAIRDAGKADFKSLKSGSFPFTPLFREFYLRAEDSNAFERDPMAINLNYRLLRNERLHRSIDVVVLEDRVLEPDISMQTPARKRWFFNRISSDELVRICEESEESSKEPVLTAFELERFNTYNEKRTMIAVAAQHLVVLASVIEETADRRR